MRDIESLVGVPFEYGGRGPDTYDCYGLVMKIMSWEGIKLPDYKSPESQGPIAAMMATQLPLWRTTQQKQGSVVLIRIGRHISHCGYMLDDELMIHAWEKTGGVTVQRTQDWAQRIVGFYRYVG